MPDGAWTCTTSASTSPPPVLADAVSRISTLAGSAGCPTGTPARVSCKTSDITLSTQPVPCRDKDRRPIFAGSRTGDQATPSKKDRTDHAPKDRHGADHHHHHVGCRV